VVAIAGPTASGKTGVSLALRERLEGAAGIETEIVSVDSAMIYRGMDIGTAKPEPATLRQVPHHLIDILDPAESYSAARFASDAAGKIDEIRARGRIPLLVGGTLLYFKALFEGLSDLPSASPELRQRLELDAAREGWPAMHARLAQVDPPTAARLHPNDAQRIQRALEIYELSGRSASDWYQLQMSRPIVEPLVRVALCPPDKEERYRRIETRFQAMVASGFVDEVRALKSRGDLHAALPSMRAVGYRQLWQHLEGEFDLQEAIHRAVIATRQYAKRQLTWLRAEPQWQWLDPADEGLIDRLLAMIREAGPV
jgi:tRNA dimethylallyltransferase